MKNLFKNLMLVAVAAMAFTACTETNDEVNAVTKKVVLEFVADLADDDTRVAFGEKDGNKYPTVWEAYDNVTVKVGDKTTSYTLTEEDVLESGKKAIIRPEFELVGDETLSGDIVATVNEYVSFDNHQGNKPTISLKAEAVYPATNLVFEHQYAYGKMELVGLPAEFNVTKVELNLVGGGNTLNHTINGYSVEDNIFWFTTKAMEAVESFSVYASNGAVTYYKEVTVEKEFAFEVGHVSAFRVKELVEKPADFNVQLTKITSMSNNVIRFEGDNAEDNITISFNPGLETIVAGHYDAVLTYVGFTNDSALEVYDEFEGSSVDVNAAGGGAWYYSANGVDVTVDGDVYTIVAHLMNYCNPGGNKTVDFTYVGKLETPASAKATLVTDTTFNGFNPYDVTFSFEDGNEVIVRFNTSGNQYLHSGDWQSNEWQQPHYISTVKYNGENASITACNVAYENDAYVVALTVYEFTNYQSHEYTFTGAIQGLNAPEACDCFEEPDPEPSVKTFTSAEVVTAYGLDDYEICFKDQDGKEFYVEFYYGNGDYVVENNILKEGTYLLDDNGTSNGLYYVDYDGFGYNGATVVVSHVDDLYNIQFTDLWKWDYTAGEKTTVPFEEAVYAGAITGLSTPAGTTPDPEPDPTPDPEPGVADGTESNPYVYACNVEYQSLMGGYYTLTFTCETEGSFNLYFETYNANLSNFTSSSLSDSSKFYSPQITGYAKNWTPGESTVTIKNIAVRTYSVDIKISTFDGYVYYTCPSVVFP